MASTSLQAPAKICFILIKLNYIKYKKGRDVKSRPFLTLILFENQIQTTSASPCRTQVQSTTRFLVCSLIFIEYNTLTQ